jgi:hypothetical protein
MPTHEGKQKLTRGDIVIALLFIPIILSLAYSFGMIVATDPVGEKLDFYSNWVIASMVAMLIWLAVFAYYGKHKVAKRAEVTAQA